METTVTTKSGKTYEVTTELMPWKSGGWKGEPEAEVVELRVNGQRVDRYVGADESVWAPKVIAAAKRYAEKLEADDYWYDRCRKVAGSPSAAGWYELPRGGSADDFFVGQRVAIYSRGTARNGLVEKVGKKNVTVVYTTASTGALWRKTGKFDEVAIQEPKRVDAPPAPARPELSEEELREHRLAGLRTERDGLRARTRAQRRPELEARLEAVEAEIATLRRCPQHPAYEPDNCPRCGTAQRRLPVTCPDDGAGRTVVHHEDLDLGLDDGRWDDDPNPYHGTYSEE